MSQDFPLENYPLMNSNVEQKYLNLTCDGSSLLKNENPE